MFCNLLLRDWLLLSSSRNAKLKLESVNSILISVILMKIGGFGLIDSFETESQPGVGEHHECSNGKYQYIISFDKNIIPVLGSGQC